MVESCAEVFQISLFPSEPSVSMYKLISNDDRPEVLGFFLAVRDTFCRAIDLFDSVVKNKFVKTPV